MDIGSRLQQVSAMIESKHKGPVWPSDWPLRVAMAAGSNGNSFLIAISPFRLDFSMCMLTKEPDRTNLSFFSLLSRDFHDEA